jgi:hypothetical protein
MRHGFNLGLAYFNMHETPGGKDYLRNAQDAFEAVTVGRLDGRTVYRFTAKPSVRQTVGRGVSSQGSDT